MKKLFIILGLLGVISSCQKNGSSTWLESGNNSLVKQEMADLLICDEGSSYRSLDLFELTDIKRLNLEN